MKQNREKIQDTHLQRWAVIYIRCAVLTFASASSSLLRARARALGWKTEDISLIDRDSGRPSLSLDESHGYTALVADVEAGGVGAVFVGDLTRLGRLASELDSFAQTCARTDTLIITESAIFDPKIIEDRIFISLTPVLKDGEILWKRP